jgi:hypothetical protein
MAKDDKKKETFPDKIGENLEEISTAIAKISRGMDALNGSRMRPKTILLLVSHFSGVSQTDVNKVLEALTNLEKKYLK